MKKPVIAALCCFLALGTATAAFAEEPTTASAPELVELSPEDTAPPFYPDSISWQEDGGQLLVVKQYSVPYGTTVADLTESTMQWNGADYILWGVTQSVEGGVTEEKEVTQDFELSVRSADAETARNDVKESVAYDDEYGFSGSLTLQDITIGETLQADSTYMATAHYAGTVTRTEAGTVHYTLLYAPVSVPVVAAAAESGITPALLIMGIACALLFIAVLLIITHLLRKEPSHAAGPAKPTTAPKVYVPSGDIVLGGEAVGHFAVDHALDDIVGREVLRFVGGDPLAVTHDGDLVGDALDLVHLVGDINDADTLIAQAAHDAEQVLDLLAGQRRRRLVEHEDLCVIGDCLRDLKHLALGDGHGADDRLRVDLNFQIVQNSLGVVVHFLVVDQSGLQREPAQPHIFHDAAVEHLIELLMHHGDAVVKGVARVDEVDLLAVHPDGARVLFIDTEQALHERRFAGAVLAHQGVDGAGTQLELGMVQRLDARELLFDIEHFEQVSFFQVYHQFLFE